MDLRLVIGALLTAALAAGESSFERRLEQGRSYWAFQPVRAVEIPRSGDAWVRADVDEFILSALRAKGLEPSPEADRRALLRRVHLDLIGLPPTPEQAREFLADDSPRAYEELVERLLASPRYGERWALKWLDVVRHADTNGFELDALRPQAWRYRDYVVDSFNRDKPYDRFILEQVAGDELFPGDAEALIATGFLTAGPRHVVGGNQDEELNRQEVLSEMTYGVGAALLGLTVQCARCHDHKFDPISQADHFRLQAVFAATDWDERNLASVEELVEHERAVQEHKARLKPIEEALKDLEAPYRKRAEALKRGQLEPAFAAALAVPEDRRDQETKRLAEEARRQIKPAWYDVAELIPPDVMERRMELRRRLHAIEDEAPPPPRGAFAVRNMSGEPPPTHILKVGDHRRKLDEVKPGFLSVLGDFGVEMPRGARGRRTALARWLTTPENPLIARVMVNRAWEFRMGRPLVEDPNNFGLLGGAPSHPELLDHLAERFVAFGWSVKALDRMIVLSSAYRQSSAIDPEKAAVDADNRLYWRAERKRLAAETLRDQILATAGRLNPKRGGEPVRVPIEPEVYDLIFTEDEPDHLWPVTPDAAEHRRRSLYLLNKRTVRLPLLAHFDQPDTMTSCAARSTSTHALQALTLLNSDFMQEQAGALAERIEPSCGDDLRCRVRTAYRLTLIREPTAEELALAEEFLAGDLNPLADLALALFNRNEFVYRP